MKAVFITKPGGPGVVQIRETADPGLLKGQALVGVKAAGINYAEIVIRTGFYPDAPPFPFIPGYEFAGVVEKTLGTNKIKEGDRVMGVTMFGAQAEKVAVDENQLLPISESVDYKEAAAIPVNFLTAYFALIKLGQLQAGEKVLIHSCAGGVGTAATQLAIANKAEVFGTTSSAEKIDFIRQQGVHHPINYKQEDFVDAVKKLTDGKGVDLVLDSVGGPVFKRSLEILKNGGRIACYGVTDMMASGRKKLWLIAWKYIFTPRVKVIDLMQNNHCVCGLAVNRFISDTSSIMPILEKMLELYSRNVIKPAIGRLYSIDEISAAHAYLESGESMGKLVLNLNN